MCWRDWSIVMEQTCFLLVLEWGIFYIYFLKQFAISLVSVLFIKGLIFRLRPDWYWLDLRSFCPLQQDRGCGTTYNILVALDSVYLISLMPHNHKIYQKRIARPCKMLSHSWPSIFNSCLEYSEHRTICLDMHSNTIWTYRVVYVHKTTYFWFEQCILLM